MKYYTTGEFSKLTGFSNKALRIYEKKGILKPQYTDPETSYRYYSSLNLIDSNIIKELKFFGCSLQEIKTFLTERDRMSLNDLYHAKYNEVKKEISHLSNILQMLSVRINGNVVPDSEEVILKTIPARKIICTRENSACNPEGLAARYFELFEILRKHKTGFSRYMAIFHDEPEKFDPSSADIETAAEIKGRTRAENNCRAIEEGLYLTFVFKGSYAGLIDGYRKIMRYADANGFVKNGPAIEVYHTDFISEKNQENFITELQVPVKHL